MNNKNSNLGAEFTGLLLTHYLKNKQTNKQSSFMNGGKVPGKEHRSRSI